MDYQRQLEDAMAAARPLLGSQGRVADYIPLLAEADADAFGMALATVDGAVYGVGEHERAFSIQSISKLFSLVLTLALGGEALWERVGREPSGSPFNSLVQLETENGIPRNPFINAGALVVTDRLHSLTGDAGGAVRDLLRTESGNPLVDTDPQVAISEAGHGHRNAALAHFLASYGNLENPVATVLDHYYAHCAITASCRDLALAGRFLARSARRRHAPADPQRRQTRQRGAADLRHVRRRRAVRVPGRPARQERRRWRHPDDPAGLGRTVRVEPGAGRGGQLGGRRGRHWTRSRPERDCRCSR